MNLHNMLSVILDDRLSVITRMRGVPSRPVYDRRIEITMATDNATVA